MTSTIPVQTLQKTPGAVFFARAPLLASLSTVGGSPRPFILVDTVRENGYRFYDAFLMTTSHPCSRKCKDYKLLDELPSGLKPVVDEAGIRPSFVYTATLYRIMDSRTFMLHGMKICARLESTRFEKLLACWRKNGSAVERRASDGVMQRRITGEAAAKTARKTHSPQTSAAPRMLEMA